MVYRKNKTIKKSKRKFTGGAGEEREIKYDKDDFIAQATEGKDNKCLYYAFFRCKFGDLNKTNEDLSKETTYNIKDINQAVFNYVLENLDRFSEEDIRIADSDSKEFQTDAHVRALAHTQNTIILVHEWNGPRQREYPHFTVFEPQELDKEKEHTIIFMSNRTNNHYTALIPKNEEIYKKYADQVKGRKISPEEIKKTKPFLGTDYGPDLSLNLEAPQPKTSSQIKSPPARAIRGSPRKGSVRDPREKQKVSFPKTKKVSIKEPKRVGDDDAPVAPVVPVATGQEESELSQGPKLQAALPSTNLAHNINNAGRILPAFEPLPVLVGLVGLGVLLSSG